MSNVRALPVQLPGSWGDGDLLNALQQGDRRAFAEIYERYWEPLHRVACRKLGSSETAEEVVQDLFVTIWERRQTVRIDKLDRYLFSALKFGIIDLIRTQAVHDRFVHFVETTSTNFDQRTEDTLALQDLTRSVERVLLSLPEKTQQVFRLSRFDCLTIPEIADQLKVSEKTVQYHLGNALRTLRTNLNSPEAWVFALLWCLL